ncbi:transcription factor bHLH30 [Amborella trichopoda]|uniref:BHLH domain-containing protein n=1 Tax=Amborella trichopoda TaxID=13333 RepID=W1NTP5_AMBTC|nr:transcription factor bHLH30 [Amborella trichopoda]XP_020519842.1 transcription factor bHLH30 [Amborella trichopoda]ERN00932.1 hypothetical protein AMTR_s00002p00019320 [Amborella trichopoda]|eukprot:XP_006838363.1 transcription factor bHLH30 [Amborella trichopoda]
MIPFVPPGFTLRDGYCYMNNTTTTTTTTTQCWDQGRYLQKLACKSSSSPCSVLTLLNDDNNNNSEKVNICWREKEAKAAAASKSHSDAERRRRERINTHLNTLRNLLPNTTKTDKASLLAEVVRHVKELKQHAKGTEGHGPIPGEADELTVVHPEPSSSLIMATLCCEDRPGLLSELTNAFKALRLRTVRAEITTLGGRVKNVFFIDREHSETSLSCLEDTLKAIMVKPGPPPIVRHESKRPRINYHNNDFMV